MTDADEWRTELAEWAERMTAARRKYREREATEERDRQRRIPAADGIRYSGLPASVVRGYQEARREKGEAAKDE